MRRALAVGVLVIAAAGLPAVSAAQAHSAASSPYHLPGIASDVRPRRWRYIIVHHSATTGGSPRAFEAYHRGVRHMPRGMAYHFVIGNGVGMADGAIEPGLRWTRQLPGAHVASVLRDHDTGEALDDVAIGICLVGNFDVAPPTPRQRRALRGLVTALRREYGIQPGRILGHGEVVGTHTACPGRQLTLAEFRDGGVSP